MLTEDATQTIARESVTKPTRTYLLLNKSDLSKRVGCVGRRGGGGKPLRRRRRRRLGDCRNDDDVSDRAAS